MTGFRTVTKSHPIPKGAGPDTVAQMVHALLSTKTAVARLVIETVNDEPTITVDFIVRSQEPPCGEPPAVEVDNLWSALLNIPMTEITMSPNDIKPEAFSTIADLFLRAGEEGGVGIGWVLKDSRRLRSFLGLEERSVTSFLNLPVIELDELPGHALVLLCAKSSLTYPLNAEWSYKVSIVGEK